jgi:hypothetical protein
VRQRNPRNGKTRRVWQAHWDLFLATARVANIQSWNVIPSQERGHGFAESMPERLSGLSR